MKGIMSEFISLLKELPGRIKFWRNCDRIGPDIPWTHWRLFFKSTMSGLCRSKFKRFEESAEVRPGVYAIGCSRISLGHRVILRPGVCLHGNPEGAEIVIEDDVMLGQGVHVYVDNHNFSDPSRPILEQGFMTSEGVTLKRGSWIGANSIILPGVIVGENSVIGAGSVVSRSIPDRVLAVGVPAKVIRKLS